MRTAASLANLNRGGRKPGSRNKRKRTHRAVERNVQRLLQDDLADIGRRALEVLKEALDGEDRRAAVLSAKIVLNKLVPDLKAIEHSGDGLPPRLIIDMRSVGYAPHPPERVLGAAQEFEALPDPTTTDSATAPRPATQAEDL